MKQYSTFLFDFDGTLLDSNAHVIRCFQLAFQEVLGVTLPEETITATFGIPLAEALEDLAPAHAEELLRVYRKHSDACGMSLLQEIDGARAVLEALHAHGCTNAIVTSKKEVNARAQMAHIGIDHLIDLLVGPEKTTAHKPDPAPVRYAINALGADPRQPQRYSLRQKRPHRHRRRAFHSGVAGKPGGGAANLHDRRAV